MPSYHEKRTGVKEILRRAMAMKAAKPLALGGPPSRVSEMWVRSVEMLVKSKIRRAVPVTR